MAQETARNLRASVGMMDQTDAGEALLHAVAQMIAAGKLQVRVYTKGNLHAKAYIFDYGAVYDAAGNPAEREERGIAIVGSSNLSLAGVTHNTELNVIVPGNANHAALTQWFAELWAEAEDFDAALLQTLQQSWALAAPRPYDIYMKTLYTLVRDRLEGGAEGELLWDDAITAQLADFQQVAVRQTIQMIKDYGGAFVADVVGLGKSYIGAAIVKYFERAHHARPLIICPAPLVEMWERYNEVYNLHARVLSMGHLRAHDGDVTWLARADKYRRRDFVLVDESHNLRHRDTQRYKVLQEFLATGRRCCFLTATPRNKTAWDIYHQLKLFHQDDQTDLPITPPNLREYFKLVEEGERALPPLLANILVRRTRNHILRWYGYDAATDERVDPAHFAMYRAEQRRAYVKVGGRKQFFPKRVLETIEYSIEETYQGLYHQLRGYLGKGQRGVAAEPRPSELCYARYGLGHYVYQERQNREPYRELQRAGANLRGLMRVLLFKRFESSVHAFRATVRRVLRIHERFLDALAEGIVPAGEAAQTVLYAADVLDELALLEALRRVSSRYNAADFDVPRLRRDIEHDVALLREMLELVEPITPAGDAKLQTLQSRLTTPPLAGHKILVFTQYADTAQYLYDNLNPHNARSDIEVIYSGDKSKARVVGRFAPQANPEYAFQPGDTEITLLVATDVLAEGLNLQDCDHLINYDLHWNPVRLIQRFGRIDRIGAAHEVIYGYNFLPETSLEEHLGLQEKLRRRIQEIHDTIGEDAAILDPTEQLNAKALYAIYSEQNGGQLSLFEDDEDDLVDLTEAEELLRQLQRDDSAEYQRIAALPNGLRAAKPSARRGLYVCCQAGNYQQLFLLDEQGELVSRDPAHILRILQCAPQLAGAELGAGYNAAVMRVKQQFAAEVRGWHSARQHAVSYTTGQKYILRELRLLYMTAPDEERQTQINTLERAFRRPLTAAVNRAVNRLRRSGVTAEELCQALITIYHQHNMRAWAARGSLRERAREAPVIVCSERLV